MCIVQAKHFTNIEDLSKNSQVQPDKQESDLQNISQANISQLTEHTYWAGFEMRYLKARTVWKLV